MNADDRRDFNFPRPSDDRTEEWAWCRWFIDHGIEPATVVRSGWVERDDEACLIRYLAFAGGQPREDPNNPDEVWTETRVMQLASPPAPFPI